MASKANPGLPPSSLASFLKANSSLEGAVLAEYDSSYTNAAFATPHDDLAGIMYEGIAAVAELLAHTLFNLSSVSETKLEVTLANLETDASSSLEATLQSEQRYKLRCKSTKALFTAKLQKIPQGIRTVLTSSQGLAW